jgi:hypothetical protein
VLIDSDCECPSRMYRIIAHNEQLAGIQIKAELTERYRPA